MFDSLAWVYLLSTDQILSRLISGNLIALQIASTC